jgi:hypothetical protein
MRTLLRASFDVEVANKAIKDGSLPKMMKEVMEKIKPEASYFFPLNGKRTCLMVFDLKEPSDIPTLVEPFFMNLNAEIELIPVMNAEDLQKGLTNLMSTKEAQPALN